MTNVWDSFPHNVVGMVVRDIYHMDGTRRTMAGYTHMVRYYALESLQIREIGAIPLWPGGARAELLFKATNTRKPV